MAPSNRRAGTHLSDLQRREMRKWLPRIAKSATQWDANTPALPARDQTGAAVDLDDEEELLADVNVVGDIRSVHLNSRHESDPGADSNDVNRIIADILLNGQPDVNDTMASYKLAFNGDNNELTGVTIEGVSGIDKIVVGQVEFDPCSLEFFTWGYVEDTNSMSYYLLPEDPIVELEYFTYDHNDTELEPVGMSVQINIPKDFLELTAVEVPVLAITEDVFGTVYDTLAFEYDQLRWYDYPELSTFGDGIGRKGEAYPIYIYGLMPNSPFTLTLDRKVMISDVLDYTGSYYGEFIFPENLNYQKLHFLVAQDQTGEFAYNISCPSYKGDMNGNVKVDFFDYAEFAAQWGKVGSSLIADIDNNGVVGSEDLRLLTSNWLEGYVIIPENI
jgi:hypothetical protein